MYYTGSFEVTVDNENIYDCAFMLLEIVKLIIIVTSFFHIFVASSDDKSSD